MFCPKSPCSGLHQHLSRGTHGAERSAWPSLYLQQFPRAVEPPAHAIPPHPKPSDSDAPCHPSTATNSSADTATMAFQGPYKFNSMASSLRKTSEHYQYRDRHHQFHVAKPLSEEFLKKQTWIRPAHLPRIPTVCKQLSKPCDIPRLP